MMDPFSALGAELNAEDKEERDKERKRRNSAKYRERKKARELERDQTLKRLEKENQELKQKLFPLEQFKREYHQRVKQLREKINTLEVQLSLLCNNDYQMEEIRCD